MALNDIIHAAGHWLKGALVKIDSVLEFNVTTNPRIESQGGDFVHRIKTSSTQALRWRDDDKGQTPITVDTLNDIVALGANYTPSGFVNASITPVNVGITTTSTGMWVPRTLSVGGDKIVIIKVENTSGAPRQVGARNFGSTTTDEPVSGNSSKTFIAITNGTGGIEIFGSGTGLIFTELATIDIN